MPPTYLQHSHCHGLEQQHVNIYHRHNLTQILIAALPAKLISTQLRRQAGDQCLTDCELLSQAMATAMSQIGRWHMRTRLYRGSQKSKELGHKHMQSRYQSQENPFIKGNTKISRYFKAKSNDLMKVADK